MSTPTKRHMNWTTTTYNSVTITGVSSIGFDFGGSTAKFAGDGDKFNTTIVNDFNEPKATLTTADIAAAIGFTPGLRSTFVSTLNDAKNGVTASSGGRTFTLANAIVASNSATGAHRQFASASITFEAESTDGTTNPLTTSAL